MKFDELRYEFEKVLQEGGRTGFKMICSSCGQKKFISFKDRGLATLITTFIIGDNTGYLSKQQLIEELARARCKISMKGALRCLFYFYTNIAIIYI